MGGEHAPLERDPAFEHSLDAISPLGAEILDILSLMERPVSEKFLSNVMAQLSMHESLTSLAEIA